MSDGILPEDPESEKKRLEAANGYETETLLTGFEETVNNVEDNLSKGNRDNNEACTLETHETFSLSSNESSEDTPNGSYTDPTMETFLDALVARKKRHGPEDISVTHILHNIGMYLCEKGEYDAAINYFSQELNILQNKFKSCVVEGQEQHMIDKKSADDLCGALLNVGNIFRKKNSLRFAIECYSEALKTYTLLGYTESHQNIKVARRIVGRMQRQLRLENVSNEK